MMTDVIPNWERARDLKTAAKRAAYSKYNVDISNSGSLLPHIAPDSRLNVIDVPKECGKLTSKELEITETPASVLLQQLRTGALSAVDCVTAFGKRALIADQLINCLTEVFLDRAIDSAQQLDEHLKRTGKVKGPLHGLPVSLKDQFGIKGLPTCMGYSAWAEQPEEKDCVLVDCLQRAGAVLYVRTNVPQSLMFGESVNPVFGRTLNPYNRTLTCGGSSGGEGALLAIKGSPLGVGTDIGGSVRIPSAFAGIYGLKPSFHRLPYGGAKNSLLGLEGIISALGPMSPDLDALQTFCSAILDQQPWKNDEACLPIAWRPDEALEWKKKKPVFGYFTGNELFKQASPSVERAVQDTVAKLRSRGYECKQIEMKFADEASQLNLKIFCADGGLDILRDAQSDPLEQGVQFILDTARSLSSLGGLSTYQNWQLIRRRDQIREAWRSYLEESGVDVIVCPVAPWPAHPHGKGTFGGYTGLFNLLNYSAGVVPHSFVLPTDVYPPNFTGISKFEQTLVKRWDPKVFQGAPVCVQVVTRRFEEEKCLAAMRIVKEAIGSLSTGAAKM